MYALVRQNSSKRQWIQMCAEDNSRWSRILSPKLYSLTHTVHTHAVHEKKDQEAGYLKEQYIEGFREPEGKRGSFQCDDQMPQQLMEKRKCFIHKMIATSCDGSCMR